MTESDWPTYLRAAMKAAQLDRAADLSRKTGVSESVISKWLAGSVQPNIPQLRKIAPALNVPVLALAVAAGHLSAKEAQLRELPQPKSVPVEDPVEREIRAAGYPPETEKALLKMRQANMEQLREQIEMLRQAGVIKGDK